MFKGNYNFFDYKYNIVGYNGQDYGSIAQYLYIGISIILLILFLFLLRKSSKDRVLKIIRLISIFLVLFYIGKTTWESIYDIKLNGSFNYWLLPLDTCSMVMYAGLLAGFAKGKIKEYSECWLATGCIVGGIGTMVSLPALNYYPFFSFGALYSMLWHFLMTFLGSLLIITNFVDIDYKTVIKGFVFHIVISLIVIPIDLIYGFDFMFYIKLSSIPIFDKVADTLINNHLGIINPFLMAILYFIGFNIVFALPLLFKKHLTRKEKN